MVVRVAVAVVVRVVAAHAAVAAAAAAAAAADGVLPGGGVRRAALRVMHFVVVHLEMNSLQ